MGVFSKSKDDRSNKRLFGTGSEVTTLSPGMLVTGNIVCEGPLRVFGRVIGDIHTSHLLICEGAQVEGNIIAQQTIIDGAFRGTIYGDNVKLQSRAVVAGEIYNNSLTIEPNAHSKASRGGSKGRSTRHRMPKPIHRNRLQRPMQQPSQQLARS